MPLFGYFRVSTEDQPPLPRLERLGRDPGPERVRAVHRKNLSPLMISDPSRVDDLAVEIQTRCVAATRIRTDHLPASDALLRALPRVQAPLAGLWGARDAFAAPRIEERRTILARFDPELLFRVLPGVGHWCPFEAPEETARFIEEGLAHAARRREGRTG